MTIARKEGVAIPKDMGKEHRQQMDRLSKLSGKAFDHAYIRDMVRDHDHDVAVFHRHAEVAHDADVKTWVQQTLPTLEEHQRLAKEDARKLGVDVTSASATVQRQAKR